MSDLSHRHLPWAATGLALLLVTGGGAGARDLPHQTTAAPTADRCAALGTGYRALAGSDTCLRLSGSVEVSATVATGHGAGVGAWMGRDTRR